MEENTSKEKEKDENDINFTNQLRESVLKNEFDESISNWSKCPSFRKSEKNMQKCVLNTVKTARFNSLLRLTTLYNNEILSKNEINLLYEQNQEETIPLFQYVPASILQIATSGMGHLVGRYDKHIEKIYSYFDENPKNASIYACMTFPAIHFYFMTSDFLELGTNFIMKAIDYKQNKLTMHFISSFLDSFPRFSEVLWQTFDSQTAQRNKSVLSAFLASLEKAFTHLTPFHSKVINHLFDIDENFALSFFINNYFHIRARQRYSHIQDDDEINTLHDLIQIFEFASQNSDSPIAKLFINALKNNKCMRMPSLAYATDIKIPIYYAFLSVTEVNIVFDLMQHCEIIQNRNKLNEIKMRAIQNHSLLPGYVQIPHRKILNQNTQYREPLLFFGNLEILKSKSADYSRAWKQLSKMSKETGKSPLDLIVYPPTPYIKSIISRFDIIKQPNFINYITIKMHNKTIRGQQKFEQFMITKTAEDELNSMKACFEEDSKYYLSIIARDLLLQKCVSNGLISVSERILFPSSRALFIAREFNRNVSIALTSMSKTCEMYYLSNNEMKSFLFSDNISQLPLDEMVPDFVLYFITHIINEWNLKTDNQILPRISLASESLRMEIFLTDEYNWIIGNHFLIDLIKSIQENRNMKHGTKLLKLSEMMIGVKLICEKFNKVEKIVETCANIIILSGVDDLILLFVWFGRLYNLYSQYIDSLHPSDIWIKVKDLIWKKISSIDKELSDVLYQMEKSIPSLE